MARRIDLYLAFVRTRARRASPPALPLVFGLDEGAWSSLAQAAAALFTLALSLVLLGALGALAYALVRELRRNTLFLDPIEVPRALDARGYSPGVVAERLLDALTAMRGRAPARPGVRG